MSAAQPQGDRRVPGPKGLFPADARRLPAPQRLQGRVAMPVAWAVGGCPMTGTLATVITIAALALRASTAPAAAQQRMPADLVCNGEGVEPDLKMTETWATGSSSVAKVTTAATLTHTSDASTSVRRPARQGERPASHHAERVSRPMV